MKSLLEKLRAYHQAFWVFDPWYRRAWYAGPPALAAMLLAFLLIPSGSAPSGAPWAKPVGGGTTTTPDNPDQKLCNDATANHIPRGAACDRVIKSGKLTGKELALGYFGRAFARLSASERADAITDYTEAIKLDPSNAMAFNNRGVQHRDNNNLVEALRDFDEAIRLTPNGAHALALSNKADLLRMQGKLSDAQAEIKKALDADRDNARVRDIQDRIIADIKSMEATQQAGPDLPVCRNLQAETKARGDACDRLIKRGGLSPSIMVDAYLGRAWMRENSNDVAGAIADYSEAIRLNPQTLAAFNNRGGLLLNRGDHSDALRDYEEALKINPKYVWALANRAEVFRRQGKLAEAQAELKKAQDVDANHARVKSIQGLITADLQKQQSPQPRPEQKAVAQPEAKPDAETEALRSRGSKHLDSKDYDSAIADYTDVIRRETATWSDFNQRGRAYMAKGMNAQALQDFERASSRAGHGPEAHYNLALVHERTGDLVKARENLEAAIAQHGATAADYFTKLGSIHSSQGNHNLAVDTFEKLVKLHDANKTTNPNDRAYAFLLLGRARKSEVMTERGRCGKMIPPDPGCMSGMRFGAAILDLQQALIFRPSYADAHFEQALIAAEVGNPNSAIEEYTKAIKADPRMAAAYNNRGVQYEKIKQRELAFADYNDAIRLDAGNKFAWANRGVLFAEVGQRQRAIEDLLKARAIDQKYEYAINYLRRLGVRN